MCGMMQHMIRQQSSEKPCDETFFGTKCRVLQFSIAVLSQIFGWVSEKRGTGTAKQFFPRPLKTTL